MNMTEARGLAAQAWCQKQTSGTVMDPDLAEEFAAILVREVERGYRAGVEAAAKVMLAEADRCAEAANRAIREEWPGADETAEDLCGEQQTYLQAHDMIKALAPSAPKGEP